MTAMTAMTDHGSARSGARGALVARVAGCDREETPELPQHRGQLGARLVVLRPR